MGSWLILFACLGIAGVIGIFIICSKLVLILEAVKKIIEEIPKRIIAAREEAVQQKIKWQEKLVAQGQLRLDVETAVSAEAREFIKAQKAAGRSKDDTKKALEEKYKAKYGYLPTACSEALRDFYQS